MIDVYYAGIVIEITGLIGICIGIFDLLSRKEKPRGYGNLKVRFKVKDILPYNHAVGKLWLTTGILVCLDGGLLLILPHPENYASYVAIAALILYILGSVYYVLVIEQKYSVPEGKNKSCKTTRK